MSAAERWRRVRELFDAASALSAAERAALLAASCAGDGELRAEVESLLAAAAEAGDGDFLEGGALAVLTTPLSPEVAAAPLPHARVGAYELLREIGRGGMGTVYLARRADGGFQQEVAVKLVRHGMADELVVRRFVAERQILAGLAHPGIARLFDGGSSENGLPFFVMEHVAGEDLLAWCDRRRLPLGERLRLFLRVCEAVQYAHQRLVVHRDLKPGNILVTADGTPKLLDFGLAKVLLPVVAEAATADLTVAGGRLMTPEYASPEQVRGEPITTASDVYSLGVVLYELLTGRRPYQFPSRRPEEVERIVCATPPPRPSTAITGTGEPVAGAVADDPQVSREQASARRDSTPSRLRRALAGDLDNIVLQALRKEPERRYASVERLAEDLRRHLDGRPVAARPDTASYRVGKFVRRHRAATAAALLVVATLIGVVTFYTARLAVERDQARLEAEKARQVSAFLSQIFELSDPERSKGAKLTARDLLDRGAASLERDLATQPEVQAAMMGLIGAVYRQLGLYDQAQPLLQRSLALRERTLGVGHPDVAESLRKLGVLAHSSGDYALARNLFTRSLAIQEVALGGASLEVARTLGDLGNTLKATGDLDGAAALFERAVAIQEEAGAANDPQLARILNNFGLVRQRQDQLEAAQALFERALAIHERNGGPDSPLVASPLMNLAWVLRDRGEKARARALQERALTLCERSYGPNHRLVANALNELGNLAADLGEPTQARGYYERAIATYEAALGPDHPDGAWSRRGLANLLYRARDYAAAQPLYERVLSIREAAYGPVHREVADSAMDLANTLFWLHDLPGAERLLRQAVAIRRELLPAGDRRLAGALGALGDVICQQGRRQESVPFLREGRDILRAAADPDVAEAQALLDRCGTP